MRPDNISTQQPCRNCGRIPTTEISLVAAVGGVVVCFEETYEGFFCKECGLALFDQVMKRHLLNTWWSPRALLFGSTLGSARNLIERNKLLSLGEPQLQGDQASVSSDPIIRTDEVAPAVIKAMEPLSVKPPEPPPPAKDTPWMENAGIAAVAVGGLGFVASGAVGGGATLAGAIVAGALNPLFFVGVPLGLYWLHRAKQGRAMKKPSPLESRTDAVSETPPTSACAPGKLLPGAAAVPRELERESRSSIVPSTVAPNWRAVARGFDHAPERIAKPPSRIGSPESERPRGAHVSLVPAIMTIAIVAVTVGGLIGYAIGNLAPWNRATIGQLLLVPRHSAVNETPVTPTIPLELASPNEPGSIAPSEPLLTGPPTTATLEGKSGNPQGEAEGLAGRRSELPAIPPSPNSVQIENGRDLQFPAAPEDAVKLVVPSPASIEPSTAVEDIGKDEVALSLMRELSMIWDENYTRGTITTLRTQGKRQYFEAKFSVSTTKYKGARASIFRDSRTFVGWATVLAVRGQVLVGGYDGIVVNEGDYVVIHGAD